MSSEVLSILVLALVFVVATARSVNMGVLSFVAAFAIGMPVLGLSAEEVLGGFPADIFLVLAGLTFLFGFAQQNGTVDLIVGWGLRLVRGRVAAAPWIFFLLAAVLISIGALFSVAIVAPLAIPFARRYRINPLMMGLMVVHGALAGAFSPISVYGSFVNSYLRDAGLDPAPTALFLGPMVVNVLIAAAVYTFMGGRDLLGRRIDLDAETLSGDDGAGSGAAADRRTDRGAGPGTTQVTGDARVTPYQAVTLVLLAALAIGAAVFQIDVGVLSITMAAVLAVIRPDAAKQALNGVSWSTVILICGVLTFMFVVEEAGTVTWVSDGIGSIGSPLLAALLLFYLAGITSALASSLGIIGVVIALAIPFLEAGQINAVGFVIALSVAATVVDVSPFSTNGALVLANVPEQDREAFYRRLLAYAGVIVAVGPALAWTLAAVPTWLG